MILVRHENALRMDEPKKILIVEYDEDCRVILTCRLRKLGRFDIREAANGQQAIDAVHADPPDLIFMDDRMPVMHGWEATKRIREMDGGDDMRSSPSLGGRWPVRSRRRSPAAA